uniref:Putative receptor-like protein kinase n=1 Tax=Populus alba TaxID=43335 RepID=A0A4U5PXR5_POPAL|nr:putative receptor-like protein kinase [Populus alba]
MSRVHLISTEYTENICSIPPVNSTFDSDRFSYASNTKNIMLYYGCPTIPSQFLPTLGLSYQFSCNISRTDMVAYASAVRSIESHPTAANLTNALHQGFWLQWTANDSLCNKCKFSGGRCGYNTDTSKFTCYCQDQPYATTCKKESYRWEYKLIKAVTLAMYTMIAVTIIVLCSRRGLSRGQMTSFWRQNAQHNLNIETIIMNSHSLTPKRYTYSEIKKMTNSFVDKLGQGGFGGVYKGELPDGRPVAVKVLKNSKGDGEEFVNEVVSVSRTSHSDVYSYGMMVLEMVGGKRNIDIGESQSSEIFLPNCMYESEEVSSLHGVITDETEETIKKMVTVGLWCVQTNPLERPSMTKVVEMLEGSLQFLQTPPKPFLYSPTTSLETNLTASTSRACALSQKESELGCH